MTEYYDERVLTENGVGAVRALVESFEAGVGSLTRRDGESILILTGESMGPFLTPMGQKIQEVTGAACEVRAVQNRFYGAPTTVAGLLGGQDLIAAVPDPERFDLILFPADALNQDDQFIDSVALTELLQAFSPARVASGRELIALVGAS
jgi:NifB/MoaA-like Fe-S oxidoreductase